jgi:hypothetical protein
MIRNVDNDRLATLRRTSICKSSVLNLGQNPRFVGRTADNIGRSMPTRRSERNYFPSHERVLSVILKCVPLRDGFGRERGFVERRFRAVMAEDKGKLGGGKVPGETSICGTPLRWVEFGLCRDVYPIERLHSLDDVFPRCGISYHLSEFILMDVILNRRMLQQEGDGGSPTTTSVHDPDDVVMASAYDVEDLFDDADYKYRTMIAFLPGAGVFYCARERRRGVHGVGGGALIQLDMSWLRLWEDVGAPPTARRFSFGRDGYVKRFARESTSGLPSSHYVSAWRVTSSNLRIVRDRLVLRASQCADSDGPRLPPDFFGGSHFGAWPAADRGQEFNKQLGRSASARVGGRHYAAGCLHFQVPDDCLVVDGIESPHVDIIVNVAPIGSCTARKSVVMVRNLGDEPTLAHDLRTITMHNSLVRRAAPVGTARSHKGDVGTMHPIGTRVLLDGITMSEYAANSKVPARMFRTFVHSLARIGGSAFPDVLAVIQDTESDAGALPCTAMSGDGGGYRVGYSVDMSVDLANASHFDVHDASQGFSVWTEETPGLASNWHFIMPNLHGVSDSGETFNGVAIKLRHGTAISWDGRVIRHCTSLSRPDGAEGKIIGQGTRNHLYGTFTAAKERIVSSGRAKAALPSGTAGCDAPSHTGGSVAQERDGHVDEVTVDVLEASFNPRIEDADPDSSPPPKDGDPVTWMNFYRWLRNWNLEEKSRSRVADPLGNDQSTSARALLMDDNTYSVPRKKLRS